LIVCHHHHDKVLNCNIVSTLSKHLEILEVTDAQNHLG